MTVAAPFTHDNRPFPSWDEKHALAQANSLDPQAKSELVPQPIVPARRSAAKARRVDYFVPPAGKGAEMLTGSREESRQPIHVMHDVVRNRAGLDVPRPTNHGRHAPSALPVVFFSLRNGVVPASGQVF